MEGLKAACRRIVYLSMIISRSLKCSVERGQVVAKVSFIFLLAFSVTTAFLPILRQVRGSVDEQQTDVKEVSIWTLEARFGLMLVDRVL